MSQQPVNVNVSIPKPRPIAIGDSKFDGGLASWLGTVILGFIITVCTLGICAPWAICMQYKWEINHTVVEGRRLKFTGDAASLFGHWIKWFLLTIITLGIYGFWLHIKVLQWKVRHTEFARHDDD